MAIARLQPLSPVAVPVESPNSPALKPSASSVAPLAADSLQLTQTAPKNGSKLIAKGKVAAEVAAGIALAPLAVPVVGGYLTYVGIKGSKEFMHPEGDKSTTKPQDLGLRS